MRLPLQSSTKGGIGKGGLVLKPKFCRFLENEKNNRLQAPQNLDLAIRAYLGSVDTKWGGAGQVEGRG